jgi:hypothetical protein
VRPVVVVFHDFALAYYIVGVVNVFVDYIILVDGVVLVAYNVFVFYYALCAGAIVDLTRYGFAAALVAAMCAVAIHGKRLLYQ